MLSVIAIPPLRTLIFKWGAPWFSQASGKVLQVDLGKTDIKFICISQFLF